MSKKLFFPTEYKHLTFSAIIHSFPLAIKTFLIPELDYTISTYHKAIQQLKQGQIVAPKYPLMVVNPQLNLNVDDSTPNTFYYPQRFGTFSHLNTPILKTDDIVVEPRFLDINLTLEITMFYESVYQKLDFESAILMFLGGYNRYTYLYKILFDLPFPNGFPEELKQQFDKKLIKTIGKELYVFPVISRPLFRLSEITDVSEKLGGDSVPTWGSSFSIDIYFHLISGLVIDSDWKLEKLFIDTKFYDIDNPPVSTFIAENEKQTNTSNATPEIYVSFDNIVELDDSQKVLITVDKDYNENEYFEIDLTDISNTVNDNTKVYVLNPVVVEEKDNKLYIKGKLRKGQHIYLAIV